MFVPGTSGTVRFERPIRKRYLVSCRNTPPPPSCKSFTQHSVSASPQISECFEDMARFSNWRSKPLPNLFPFTFLWLGNPRERCAELMPYDIWRNVNTQQAPNFPLFPFTPFPPKLHPQASHESCPTMFTARLCVSTIGRIDGHTSHFLLSFLSPFPIYFYSFPWLGSRGGLR